MSYNAEYVARMVMEHLLPPTVCHACGSPNIEFKDSGNKSLWPYVWECKDCEARVHCHSGTKEPLGYMANAFVRRLRAELHTIVDPIWKSTYATRDEIYEWLAKELLIPNVAHISQLSVAQLKLAIELARKFYKVNESSIVEAKRKHDRSIKNEASSNQTGRFVHANSVRFGNRSRKGRNSRTDRKRY